MNFIELTTLDGDTELVNVTHIKRIYTTSRKDAGTSVEWTHAPAWNNNPLDYVSWYKESPREILALIDYALCRLED